MIRNLLGLLIFCTLINGTILAQQSTLIADGAELTLVSNDFSFTEGPIADFKGSVYFTDQPNNKIHVWTKGEPITVFMDESGRANGLYFDHDGNLLAAADGNNELWSINPEKEVTVLVADYQDKKLNGPNDIWVDPKGGIYFTDPYYQRDYWTRTEPEITEQRVYYLSPENNLTIAADDVVKPNGIIGTPDGKTLYVADIGDGKTYSYTINNNGSLSNQTLITELGSDGMTLDEEGNIYLTGDGVIVFNAEGEQIEHIKVPQPWTANVTFGGPENQTLFITASTAVYTLEMRVAGAE
jgi:gluconolactonase